MVFVVIDKCITVDNLGGTLIMFGIILKCLLFFYLMIIDFETFFLVAIGTMYIKMGSHKNKELDLLSNILFFSFE